MSQNIYINKIKECGKLKLYSSVKTNPGKEKYLCMVNDAYDRKIITQLRLSCHKFPIETGRYNNIPNSERMCHLCKFKVGTELHCLMECFDPNLTKIRNKFLGDIFKINYQLSKLPRQYLFEYILLFIDKSIIIPSLKYFKEIVQNYPLS